MKKILILLVLTTISFGQNTKRNFLYSKGLHVNVSDGAYHFKFINSNIVETTFIPNNEKNTPESVATISVNSDNYDITSTENANEISISYQNLTIKITKQPFQISYSYKNKTILSEKLGYLKRKHTPLDIVKDNIKADSTEVLQFALQQDELLYGGGARALGMNRRGNKLALYNRAHYGYEDQAALMNFTLPIVISSNKYMVHFDNAPVGYLDLDSQKNNTLEYETISGRKTYQLIVGDTWEDLTTNYTLLTGRQPLPPRWAFGNFASRFGYHSEAEARKTIEKFKTEKIPVDAIILDLYWFGKTIQGTMGNLEVYRDSFPNFEKMISDFNKIGVKTITITEPFILTTSAKWNDAVAKNVLCTAEDNKPATWDFYFGNTGLVDVFKPEGKKWFWDIYKNLINNGVGGVWGDLGEPEVFPSFAHSVKGLADEVHNIYGHQWAKMIYEGYQKDFPTQRPFILMRAGAAGSQRYGMIPWSGDVNRTWGGLSKQVEIALQMGMQGMAYMHSDLGGFAGANLDDELYVRWLQYGVFNPVFRPHAQEEVPSEAVYRSDWAKKIAKQAIELRYQLLPYNYTLAFKNSTTGTPLMRPLFFEDDTNDLLSKSDGYLWGNDFLVYPVLEKGQKTKEIYFPKSANWYDFYTGKRYEAGATEILSLVENYIPTFVKAGSFIPTYKVAQTTSAINYDEIIVHYFRDNETTAKGYMYEDNEQTPEAIDKNDYGTIHFKSTQNNKKLLISTEAISRGNYKMTTKQFEIVIHNCNKAPKNIKVNGNIRTFEFNKQTQILIIKAEKENNQNTIEINF